MSLRRWMHDSQDAKVVVTSGRIYWPHGHLVINDGGLARPADLGSARPSMLQQHPDPGALDGRCGLADSGSSDAGSSFPFFRDEDGTSLQALAGSMEFVGAPEATRPS
ncbi:hypothetical protein E4U53_003063 [Claviceps sorghi]|nr:hypothetical protein E4U53_003063 [Claviceps sorghi]